MFLMFSIVCNGCGCKSEISTSYYCHKTSFACPNCGEKFPQEHFEKLQNVIETVHSIPETVGVSEKESTFEALFNDRLTGFRLQVRGKEEE